MILDLAIAMMINFIDFRVSVRYISLSESPFCSIDFSSMSARNSYGHSIYLHVYWKMSPSFAYSDE